MKRILSKKDKKTAIVIIMTVLCTLLAAAAVYCIRKYLLDKHEAPDEEFIEDEEEYIDENGVCYTDERNFVN